MSRTHKIVAIAAGVALFVEALVLGAVFLILGLVVRRQHMSLAGLDPQAMAIGAWAGGAVFAVFLLCCAALLLRTGIQERPLSRVTFLVTLACALAHGVLAAAGMGPLGWALTGVAAVILALLVLTLLAPRAQPEAPPADTGRHRAGGPIAGTPPLPGPAPENPR